MTITNATIPTLSPVGPGTPAASLRTATRARRTSPIGRRQDPTEATSPVSPQRSGRGRWIAALGLAAVVGAVGVITLGNGNDAPTTPAEPSSVGARPDVELPGDLVVSGNNVTRTYDSAASEQAEAPTATRGPNADIALPSPISIEPGAPVALSPVIIGEPVVMFGSVACIPFQHLGPNADLGRDSSGRYMSGREVLEQLRQRGPNADLPFDPNGMRSSGNDPICVTG